MKTRLDAAFFRESERYRLRFVCEDCAHWGEGRCGNGYPPGPRRRDVTEGPSVASVAFCKEYELR